MDLPRIWLLTGAKSGDNAQAERLIGASGLPFERRRVVLKAGYDVAKPRIEATLHHVDLNVTDTLAPPWPDLVLTIGRCMAMVALWIKAQTHGRTKLVLIGPPRRGTENFDLIVVPFHYRGSPRPNTCRIDLPLLSVEPDLIAAAGERWKSEFAELPRPLTVLLCGGSISGRSFDPQIATKTISTIARMNDGGNLQVSTSRRTPAETTDAIARALPPGSGLYRWEAGSSNNPYLGLLAHGDRFVVTADSVSMLVEIARLGKPLSIAPLRRANRATTEMIKHLGIPDSIGFAISGTVQVAKEWFKSSIDDDAPVRDITILHNLLYQKGWAVPLGEQFRTPLEPPSDDTAIAAARLRALLFSGD